MKKLLSVILASALVVSMVAGCSSSKTETKDETKTENTETTGTVYNVCNLVNGNLGDKSFFDSAEAGLKQLQDDGRITYTTIEMGGSSEDQAKWQSYLEEVSASGEYDIIICGTYQMPDYLRLLQKLIPIRNISSMMIQATHRTTYSTSATNRMTLDSSLVHLQLL